jgi:hypothetical protein
VWDCGILGGSGVKKSHIFVCRNKKNPTIGQPTKCHKSKVWYLPFMSFLEMEHPTPLAAAAATDTLLGLRCLAWLMYSAKLALLSLHHRNSQAAEVSAWAACSRHRAKMGGGSSACFARLVLGSGR